MRTSSQLLHLASAVIVAVSMAIAVILAVSTAMVLFVHAKITLPRQAGWLTALYVSVAALWLHIRARAQMQLLKSRRETDDEVRKLLLDWPELLKHLKHATNEVERLVSDRAQIGEAIEQLHAVHTYMDEWQEQVERRGEISLSIRELHECVACFELARATVEALQQPKARVVTGQAAQYHW